MASNIPNEAIDQAPLAGSVSADPITIIGLIVDAHWIVKLVMLALVASSIWSWAVIIEKLLVYRDLRAKADAFERAFWGGGTLDQLFEKLGKRPGCPMAATFAAAMKEWDLAFKRGIAPSGDGSLRASLRERIERAMNVTIQRELNVAEKNLGFLASVGSVSPFVGLFGTVWGIMNSFTAIAASRNTSLPVVAPGIAEALFATAVGLFAAIPAVLFYNKLTSDLGRYADRLDSFSSELIAILGRNLEERKD